MLPRFSASVLLLPDPGHPKRACCMAFYSVWDWNRNSYRVYETRTPVSVGDDPKAPKPSVSNPIGADPDTDANPIPSGARLVGYSHFARGEIRRMPTSILGDNGDDGASSGSWFTHPVVMFMAGAAATVAYFKWWEGKR